MTAKELCDASAMLFGSGHVAELARQLGRDRTQVWRWLSGRVKVPGPVAAAVRAWVAAKQSESKRTGK